MNINDMLVSRKLPRTLAAFEENFSKGPKCWIWQGPTRRGYGRFAAFCRHFDAHRAAYVLYKGPIPTGLYVLHRCNNPGCVNPDHLYAGTHAQNMADLVASGKHVHKFSAEQVRAIRSDPRYQYVIAAEYGVRQSSVGAIKARKTYRHIG